VNISFQSINHKFKLVSMATEFQFPWQQKFTILTVGFSVFEEVRFLSKCLVAVFACEALWVVVLADGLEALVLDALAALAALRSNVLLPTVLAVQETLLLHETNLHQVTLARTIRTLKVLRTEKLQSGRYERAAATFHKSCCHGDPIRKHLVTMEIILAIKALIAYRICFWHPPQMACLGPPGCVRIPLPILFASVVDVVVVFDPAPMAAGPGGGAKFMFGSGRDKGAAAGAGAN
jgi:hypothetical protein